MINPTFCETITHYQQKKVINPDNNRSEIMWERKAYKNCYFGANSVENLSGNTLSQASSYTVRIPYDDEKKVFTSGDIIVCGEVTDEISNVSGSRTADLIAKYKPDCFTVRTITDNTKIPHGAHYKLTGA